MRTIEVTLYKFDELSLSGKENARDWYRSTIEPDFDHVIDDFVELAEIIGIEFDCTVVPLMNGKTRRKPKIYFSGFNSQGDGACFEGTYRYEENASEKIRQHAPMDTNLHKITDQLTEIQKKYKGELYAQVKHTGRYYHEHSTDIDIGCDYLDLDEDGNEVTLDITDSDSDKVIDLLRDLMRWLYCRIDAENDYQHSDEVIEESIRANDYEFTEDGKRA